MHNPVVLLVCQLGDPIRGVSPYGDALLAALRGVPGVTIEPVDYLAAYPGLLHPASRGGTVGFGDLHWGRPATWRRLARMKGDIIHLQHWLPPMACYLASLAAMARRAGKRVVITVHNPDPHEALPWIKGCERKLFSRADALVVHDSGGVLRLRERFAIPDEKIHEIPHGIKVRGRPPLPESNDYMTLRLDPSRRYVCMFGNLRGYKGIDVLLAAWARVAAGIPDVDLVIAGRLWAGQKGLGARLVARLLGTGRDAQRIQAMLAMPEVVERVHLREGFQPDENIDALLRISDFAIFPYVRFASQSGAACRSAGLGCPVLVSDVGGLPEIAIDRSWVVPKGDVDALESRLRQKLLSPNLKVWQWKQLGRVQCYDWPQVAAAHAAIYHELI